ncbi:hypothetical protein LZC95_13705 [Pendulispora brunnea]|uniref:MFS transporter n=1 Tax=Pendulispora brunnea TaxID=2905690 RepID=A0ABZ2KLP4_9BACT
MSKIEGALSRGESTRRIYAAHGVLGYLLSGFGVILPELRQDLGLGRAEVALYPSAFALGLVLVGLCGDGLLRALGAQAMRCAIGTQIGGALLLASGWGRIAGGLGALLFGLGLAIMVNFAPARLRDEHAHLAPLAIAEATGLASASSVLAPLVLGASLSAGKGWHIAFVAPPLVAALPLVVRSMPAAGPQQPPETPPERTTRAPSGFFLLWLDIVLVVSVEFSVLFWAADFLQVGRKLAAGTATSMVALFVSGMASGRLASSFVLRHVPRPGHVLAASAALAIFGYAIFWQIDHAVAAALALFVTGLGVALLYPLTLGAVMASWPDNPNRAAARGALASGCAIGLAPLCLGAIADAVDLRFGMLLTPLILVAFLIRCIVREVKTPALNRGALS